MTILPPHPSSASLDHVIPAAQGGSHDRDNLQLAHRSCNEAKADTLDRTETRTEPAVTRGNPLTGGYVQGKCAPGNDVARGAGYSPSIRSSPMPQRSLDPAVAAGPAPPG